MSLKCQKTFVCHMSSQPTRQVSQDPKQTFKANLALYIRANPMNELCSLAIL